MPSTRSVADTEYVTDAPLELVAAAVTGGAIIVGGVVSLTVTN